jgi:hypothetical protein
MKGAKMSPAFREQTVQLVVDAGIDHDGARAGGFARLADALRGFACLFGRIDKRNAVRREARVAELREQAVTDGFRGDSRAVGHVEHGACRRHGSGFLRGVDGIAKIIASPAPVPGFPLHGAPP